MAANRLAPGYGNPGLGARLCRASSVKPAIQRKAAATKSPRGTLHRRDLMSQRAWKNDQLVLLRDDAPILACRNVRSSCSHGLVEPQFTSAKLFRLAMEEINKRDLAPGDLFLPVVAVPAKEVSVITGRYLRFDSRDWK